MSAITAEMELELESELAHEHEHEFEHEHEHEHEFEHEHEAEHESEMEQEAFFNHLAAMADRGGQSQGLRRIALAAARQALRSYQKAPPGIEGEGELEHEMSFELETESNPLQAEHANAMMEHMSHEAVTAESEQEAAEQFLPLIPLAAKFILPMAAKLGARALPALARRVAPHLTRGVAQVARTLFRSKATRPLLRTLPNIARRTMASLARRAAHGRPITPRAALGVLARQAVRTLGNPRHAVTAFRRSRSLDRRYHVAARRLVGRPSGPARRGGPWRWRYGYRGYPGYRHQGYYRHPYYQRRQGYQGPATQPVYTAPGLSAPYVPPMTPGAAPVGSCQCFQPVSCATCHR